MDNFVILVEDQTFNIERGKNLNGIILEVTDRISAEKDVFSGEIEL